MGGGGGKVKKVSVHEYLLSPVTSLQKAQAQAEHDFFFPHMSPFVTNLRLLKIYMIKQCLRESYHLL